MVVPNILAHRYASSEMVALFDQTNRVRVERQFWVAVLKAQKELGLPIEAESIEAYTAVIDTIDLESIEQRDRVLKHDVKARLDEFSELAGYQDVHKGLTSRDLTENVERLLVWRALDLIESRTVALLATFAELAAAHSDQVVVGRTHNVPAQVTTIGKRLAQFGEELLMGLNHLNAVRRSFAIRGIKGPVGSQQDQLDLLGSQDKALALEQAVADYLEVPHVMGAVGQVYPRSLDLEVVSSLVQLASGAANFANSVRLMAGHDLATEGFGEGQVGSSAMPHKMNTRSCERINGLFTILRGHLTMAASLAGDQWNEGDVSCSVVRRVVLPDAFFAIDGLTETTFAVLNQFGVFPEVIDIELRRYLPFLATTKLLMHAVRNGMGREQAHEIVKLHAVETALAMRAGNGDGKELVRKLAANDDFPGSEAELFAVVDEVSLGAVESQVAEFCAKVDAITKDRTDATYRGADIL